MKLNTLIEQTFNSFIDAAQNTQLVLLHPRSKFRSALVANLVGHPDLHTFYYAMTGDDLDLASLLAHMTHDLANQHPTFGRNINMLTQYYSDSKAFDDVVNAFAKDLAEISDDPYFFILDEYDLSDSADDIQRFIEHLLDVAPPHCTFVINSRTLPRLPWVALVAQQKAVLLEDTELITDNFYELTEPHSERDNLEIYALGPGHVLMNGTPIDSWEGHLPRLLFFFALDRPVITRSEICSTFWPDLESEQAVNVFHVTKRRLHKALEMDVLVHEDGYYRINPELGIKYDVMDFVSALMEGRNTQLDIATRLKAWTRIVEMYSGPFLQGHIDTWILARREDYQVGYLEALTSIAYERLKQDRKEQALAMFQKAVTENNRRQDIHREIMKLYASMGRRSEAASHYKEIAEQLKIEPETKQTYTDIMQS